MSNKEIKSRAKGAGRKPTTGKFKTRKAFTDYIWRHHAKKERTVVIAENCGVCFATVQKVLISGENKPE